MSWEAAPSGKRGRQQIYSDASIQTCLSMKVLFGMALRQTTGFVESLLRLIGLNWTVPDFSTLSRRQKTLAVNVPYRGSKGPLHLLIDIEPVSATGSSEPARGIKVEGEGECSIPSNGAVPKARWRRIWRRCAMTPLRALLHKSVDGRGSPFPGQNHPTASVTGMPSAV